jgi:hypothetical protein
MIVIAICLIGLVVFSGCENKDDLAEGNSIVGKWVNSNSLIDGRVIVLTENLYVEQFFDYIFANQTIPTLYLPPYATYSLSSNKITFTIHYSYPTVESFSETFEYVLKGNSLVIKGFSNPFSLTQEVRTDVHFTKIK